MTSLQIVPTRPDPFSIGTWSIASASAGLGQTSQLIQQQLQKIALPSPTFSGQRPTAQSLEEKLYDALASFKIRTATVAMYLDRERRSKLFRQLDGLLAVEDWEVTDPAPSIDSFATFLRLLTLLKPARLPGLGASGDGNLIAAWTVGDDRLTAECMPRDIVRWHLSASINRERERSAGTTPLRRLSEVLRPYDPGRWFEYANHLPAP
jgi:hypothetical protein